MSIYRFISKSLATLALGAVALTPVGSGAAVMPAQYWFNGEALRLAGADRYETATKVSEYEFGAPGAATTIVVASGESFADALVAGPLASRLNAPLILTRKDSLPEVARKNIKWVFDGAADVSPDVIIVGGVSAVSEAVELELRAIHANLGTLRLAGIDRYETARLVASYYQGPQVPSSIFLANGSSFPDALAASGPVSDRGVNYDLSPILLVKGQMLDPNLSSWIDDQFETGGLKNVYLAGGTSVLDSRVESEVDFLAQQHGVNATIVRLSGANRYETAKAIASYFYPAGIESVGIASGETFPDALVGGQDSGKAFISNHQQAFLLTTPDTLHTAVQDFMTSNAATLNTAVVYGGTSAVSEAVRLQIESYL